MSTDFPTAPLASRFINQRAAAPWKSLSLRLTHRNPDTPKNREALASRCIQNHSRIGSLTPETALRPASDIGWKASFPALERWQPARKAFCVRLGLSEPKVDEVMSKMTKRSHLATTTPVELSNKWAEALGVSNVEIFRYFCEAGYTHDYDAD